MMNIQSYHYEISGHAKYLSDSETRRVTVDSGEGDIMQWRFYKGERLAAEWNAPLSERSEHIRRLGDACAYLQETDAFRTGRLSVWLWVEIDMNGVLVRYPIWNRGRLLSPHRRVPNIRLDFCVTCPECHQADRYELFVMNLPLTEVEQFGRWLLDLATAAEAYYGPEP